MWLSIGSLSFPVSWVAIVIAFFLTTGMLLLLKKKHIADYYGNAIFIFIITWKLSVILFQFKFSIQNPLTILYFNGGIKGFWLGLIAGCIYLFIIGKRKKQAEMSIGDIFQVWLMTFSIYEIVISIVDDYPLLFRVILILINFGFVVMAILKNNQIRWLQQLLILFTVIQLLIYSVMDRLFSVPIMTYIIVVIALLIISKIKKVGAK
ncbi:hypothetical protein [Bacillus sp. FSL K6-3431]|uniref:hypothetical protein n=1 Tax=Bacillus sp. FSL K6-3431 TaxID=2921500 RepID=UPI0030F7EB93